MTPHPCRCLAVAGALVLTASTLAACSSSSGDCPLTGDTIADYFVTELNSAEQTVVETEDEELPELCLYQRTFADAEEGTYARIGISVGFSDTFTEEDFAARVADFDADSDEDTYVEEVAGVMMTVDEARGAGAVIDGEHYWVGWTDYRDGQIHRPALAKDTTGADAAHVVRLLILTGAGADEEGWMSAGDSASGTPQDTSAAAADPADAAAASTDAADEDWGNETSDDDAAGGVWADDADDEAPGYAPFPEAPEQIGPLPGSEDDPVESGGSTEWDGGEVGGEADHELVGTVLAPPDPMIAVFELWETPGYPDCAMVVAGTPCVGGAVIYDGAVIINALRSHISSGADDSTRDTAVLLEPNADGTWTVARYWETENPLDEFLPAWAS
ncbi:hypothetical protein [Zhihengliuella flava]|uniref:DUF3558 domain-containing protein n=1 Tax=Zhihengliuella flava TaxID=1285193 RepID=A0A931DCU1_9MICC|nr:hypothetical protein [Zhihengliuella flava]MBG6084420.1 hypothetical protein [Zhihengliuella flava]